MPLQYHTRTHVLQLLSALRTPLLQNQTAATRDFALTLNLLKIGMIPFVEFLLPVQLLPLLQPLVEESVPP